MTSALSMLQALAGLAVLVGVAISPLPLYAVVLVDAVLVLVGATAVEVAARKAHSAPSDRRSGPHTGGGV